MVRKFFYISRRKMYFYLVSLMADGYEKILPETKRWFINPLNLLIVFRNDDESWWYPEDLKQYEKVSKFYSKNPEEILKEIKTIDENFRKIEEKKKKFVKSIKFSFETNYVEEIGKMKKGDVLVSGSTGPEMILACKKAGAIVTDEGGITSHAALVSRELGIPSVIATKFATKVLKDGDIVEVDANKGIVKILKK